MKVQNASSSLASTLFLPTKLSHLVSGLRGTKKWMERWSLASETHTHTHTHTYIQRSPAKKPASLRQATTPGWSINDLGGARARSKQVRRKGKVADLGEEEGGVSENSRTFSDTARRRMMDGWRCWGNGRVETHSPHTMKDAPKGKKGDARNLGGGRRLLMPVWLQKTRSALTRSVLS